MTKIGFPTIGPIRYYIYDTDGNVINDSDVGELFRVSWVSMWPKGYGAFSAKINRDVYQAWGVRSGYRIVAMEGLTTVYDGRLSAPKVNSDSSVSLNAFGWYIVLNERRLHKRWYDTLPVKRFVWPSGAKGTEDQESPIVEKRDKDEVFRLSMRADDTELDETNYYQEQYLTPTGSIYSVEYSVNYRTGEGFDITIYNDDNTTGEDTNTLTSTTPATDDQGPIVFSGGDTGSFTLRVGPDTPDPGPTDTYDQNDWIAFSQIEVQTTLHASHSNTGTPVYSPDELIEDVLLYARETDLSADMSGIAGDTTALGSYITKGDTWQTAASIIEDLAAKSDSSFNTYGLAVWDGDLSSDGLPQAFLTQRSIASDDAIYDFTWQEFSAFQVEWSEDELYNFVIVKYTDGDGIVRFISGASDSDLTDADSVAFYGERHSEVLDAGESTAANAKRYGQRYLAYHQNPLLKGSFSIQGNGAARLKAGMAIRIYQSPISSTQGVSRDAPRISQLVVFIREVRYDVDTDTATLIPDLPPDTSEAEMTRISGRASFGL